MTEQPLLGRDAEHPCRRTGADDDRSRTELPFANPHAERRGRKIDAIDVGGDELGAEPLGLLAELHHELGAEDAVGEAGKVLDVGGEHELAAGADALDHDRAEIGATGVDRGGEPGGPRSDDHRLMHFRHGDVQTCASLSCGLGFRRVQRNAPGDHEDSAQHEVGEPDVAGEHHERGTRPAPA